MTKARFLAEVDSMEIQQWLAYFKAKGDAIEEQRQSAEFQRRIEQG